MSENFIIGGPESTTPCYLKFHQFDIYNSIEWTQSGTLKWNAETKQIYVLPDVIPPNNNINEKKRLYKK